MRISERLRKAGVGVIVAVTLAGIGPSCKTTPPRPTEINEQKDKAAELTEAGNEQARKGNFGDAMTFYDRAVELNLQVDNQPGIIRNYNDIGRMNMLHGRLPEADGMFSEALRMARAIEDPILVSISLGNIGQLRLMQNDVPGAEKALLEAMESAGEEDTPEKAVIMHNLGAVRKAQGEYDAALELYERAAAVNEKEYLFEELASNYYMTASVYSKKNDFPTAIEYANRALQVDKRMEHGPGIGKDYLALGLISRKAGEIADAYRYFQKSFQVYRALGFVGDTMKLLTYLVETAESLGKSDEATEYRKALETLRSSIQNSE